MISVGLMCAVLVLALATWRGSRAAEFAACAIVLLVSVLTVVAASRRSSSIGEWASVAIDLAVLAVIGIGLRIYHHGPT